jgi:hypothetical protein
MSKALSKLLEKEVTRKEFLQFLGAALITIFGLNNFIALLTQTTQTTTSHASDKNGQHGFGSSRFGA